MAESVVPFYMARSQQCILLSGASSSMWKVRRLTDIGNPGTALGLGKDKGMEIFKKHGDVFALYRLTGKTEIPTEEYQSENRVADLEPYILAYLSPCRNCKNCGYDCRSESYDP